jgi:hypothetical protein
MRPSTKAYRVVDESLKWFAEWLRRARPARAAKKLRNLELHCFTFDQLVKETDKLLAAHEDRGHVYHPTEYHWLLLDRVLQAAFATHNASCFGPGKPTLASVGIHLIDFDAFRERWFWDMDYEIPADSFNAAKEASKDYLGLSEGAFGCINRLPAHETDLVMKREPLVGGWRKATW